jgi:hypothetical protein
MLPATALQQLVVIPDDAFSPCVVPGNSRQHVYLDFFPDRRYTSEITIAPHHHEAWLNVHLFKLALFCREHNIKLISIGHENQLPFFGMFSDAVVLQRGPLDDMFGWYSTFATDTTGFDSVPGWVDVYKHDDLPWGAFPATALLTVPDARRRFSSPLRAIYGHYTAEHVIGVFSDCRVFVRERDLAVFNQLNSENALPRNAIWCEVKEQYGKMNARLQSLLAAGLPLVGLDKALQRQLVRDHGSAFMTLQILCSLRNGCRMLLGAGSAHVFAVAPANLAMALAPADRFYNAETENIVRKINQQRFGSVPYTEEATLTWLCANDARCFSAAEQDEPIAHWQLDYFLSEPALRAYLECQLRIPPRQRVEETSWAAFRSNQSCAPFVAGRRVRFQRADGAWLSDVLLQPAGTLEPRSTNETYWTQVGETIAFKTELGQVSTVFTPAAPDVMRGPFIYNQDIEHQLKLVVE